MANTLLVGVGGSGCKVAQKVYKRLKSQKDSNLRYAILGVDTDTGDIQNRQGDDSTFPLVQISSNRTIYDTIKGFEKTETNMDWLPEKLSYEVYSRTLLDGAGMLRFLSRLALAENMRSQYSFEAALNRIKDQLFSNINDIRTPDNQGSVDVMIIGSIAGGTGSGIFLSIALYLRDWFETLGVSAMVRGFFLLPNVFIGRGLPASQYENVRANAYASLSEINAVMHAVQGSQIAEDMNFEYAPDRYLKVWDSDTQAPSPKPFQFVYLMDGNSPGGRSINGSIDDYYRMASDSAFQLLHTPLGKKVDSIYDNEVRARNADCVGGTSSCYAAVGVSGVVYPQGEIERFLALKYSAAGLSDQWLKIDKLYYQELHEYTIRKNAGDLKAQKPNKGDFFVKTFDSLSKEASGQFFAQLRQQVYVNIQDEQGNTQQEITFEKFLSAISKKIKQEFWTGERVSGIYELIVVNGLERLEFEQLKTACAKYERIYEQSLDELESHINEEPLSTFRTLWYSGENTKSNNLEDYHFQKWLLSGLISQDAPPHPLQLRYFLYSLKKTIKDDLANQQNIFKNSQKGLIKALGKVAGGIFDDPDTENIERATDELKSAANSSIMSRFFSGFEKDFIERYEAHSYSVTENLKKFGNSACMVKTYEFLLKQIDAFLNVLESFFSQLEDLNDELAVEIDAMLDKHGSHISQGDNYLYVMADRNAKQALWQTVAQEGDVDNDSEINQVIVSNLYAFYKEQRDQVRDAFDTRTTELEGIKLFREEVIEKKAIDKIRQRYASKYQMSVVSAIHKQELLMKSEGSLQEDGNLLNKLIDVVYQQAQPFVDINYINSNQHFSLWGLNRENENDLKTFYPNVDLRNGKKDSSTVNASGFSSSELLLFDISPGLQANNLNMFIDQGEYISAYNEVSSSLVEQLWATPEKATATLPLHLDYRWHYPGVLPSISQNNDELLLDTIKTYAIGNSLELLTSKDYQEQPAVYYNGRLLVMSDHADVLLDEIIKFPPLVNEVLNEYSDLSLEDQFKLISEPSFLFTILDLLRWDKLELVDMAIDWVFEQLRHTYSQMNPTKPGDQCKIEVEKVLEDLLGKVKKLPVFNSLESREQQIFIETMELSRTDFINKWQNRLLKDARSKGFRR